MKTIVFIGDSIIEGAGDDEHGGWTRRVATLLPEGWRTVHAGVGGNTIVDILARMESDCLAYDPTLIVLGVGMNDARLLPSRGNANEVPLHEFEAGLDRFVDILERRNKNKDILVGLTPVDEKRTMFYEDDHLYTNRAIRDYDLVLQEFAATNGLPYVPVFDDFITHGGDEKLTADGLHPNPEGHQLIADRVSGILIPALSQVS